MQIRLPTLSLKPRGDVIRSLKQGYQWPTKRTCVLRILSKKSTSSGKIGIFVFRYTCFILQVYEISRNGLEKDTTRIFLRSLHNTRMAILPTSFWPCHSKLKRTKKSAILKGYPIYQLTSNFTFTNILRYK